MRIRFPQSPLRLFRLGIAGALLCGCAAARPDLPGAEIGHLHRYTAEAGQQLRYGTTVEMQMSGDSALPIDMAMTMEMTVAMDILSAGPEGLEGEVGIEDLSLGGDMGQAMESVMGTGLLDVLKGTRTEFRVGPHGKIDDALSRGEIGTDMFSNVSQLSRMIFIRWPDRPIEAGATWQDSLVMQVNQMGVDLQSKILDDFTYQGIQAVDLEGVMTEVHVVQKKSRTVASGGGDVEEVTMDMVISGSSEATLYFDTMYGLLVGGISRDSILMDMTMTVPAEMTVSMQMDSATTIRRIIQ